MHLISNSTVDFVGKLHSVGDSCHHCISRLSNSHVHVRWQLVGRVPAHFYVWVSEVSQCTRMVRLIVHVYIHGFVWIIFASTNLHTSALQRLTLKSHRRFEIWCNCRSMACIPLLYLFSWFFRIPTMAFLVLSTGNLFIGLVTTVTVMVMKITAPVSN